MRALSVLLCVLMTVSSFSVLTAFATENKTNNTQATDVNKNSTVVDVDGQKFGTGDLGKSDDDNAPTISSENQYYSIVAKEEGTTKAKAKAQALDGDSDLPSKVDNSQSKYFPPIKSQGRVGSCVAWAETYYQFSYTQNKKLNRTATYENSFSPLWTYNFTNFSDDIGSYDSATYSVLRNIGAPTIKNSPNITDPAKWTATKEAFDEAQKYKLSSYSYISTGDGETPITNSKSSNLDTVKTALINGEVLTFSTHASYGFTYGIIQKNSQVPENTKYAGQYIVPYLVSTRGGHRMTIVGYDDDIWYDINEDGKVQEGEKGAFKVANSWGDDWMNNGYIWISYDSINITSSVNNSTVLSNRVRANCIDNIARISVKPVSDCSNINLEYTLSSKSRNDIEIKIIAKNKATGSTYSSYSEPFETYSNYYVNNDYSFDGTKTEAKGTFTYDLNSIVKNLNSNNVEDYTMKMNKSKVAIVGCGLVGSTTAFSLVTQGVVDEVLMIDINKERAYGEKLDLHDSIEYLNRNVKVTNGDYSDCSDADIVVITAGAPPKPGQSRLDTLELTANICKSIVGPIMESGFDGIFLIVSNPVDIITHYVKKLSGLPKNQVIGTGTAIDSARLKTFIGELVNVDPRSVHAYSMGEHGDSQMVPWSVVTVAGKPFYDVIADNKNLVGNVDLDELVHKTAREGWEIFERKGTTYYGIATAVAAIIKAIMNDENKIIPVSTYLEGEYGETDVYAGVPTVLNRHGAYDVLEIHMSPSELARFKDSAKVIREYTSKIMEY